MRALVLALALAACSSSPPAQLPAPQLPQRAGVDPIVAARAEGVRFLARGGEPVPFSLSIYDDRVLLLIEDERPLQFPAAEQTFPRWNGVIYTARMGGDEIVVNVRRYLPCPDQPGYSVVDVSVNGGELHGCGREIR
jgi:hypothetical protein